jgi:hypothetical protein
MALYVLYLKKRESETEVEYQYWETETEPRRHVIIDKTGPLGFPTSSPDRVGRKLVTWINGERTDGEWPEGGSIQI